MAFNRRDSRTLKAKPVSEHVIVSVPAIIERDEFEAVQSMLKVRNPKVTLPRVVTGSILLTGLAICATCGGGMTLRAGTSKNGTVHRYYTCSNAARAGKAAEVDGRIIRLQGELAEVETRLKRIYSMIEDGIAEMDDILRDRIAGLKIDRERIQTSLDRARTHAVPASDIPPAVVEEFGRMMRENITSGDIPFRKAYIQAVVDKVEVGDKRIKIIGSKAAIHQAMTGSKKIGSVFAVLNGIGAPDWIRTSDPCLRRAVLYPAELRVHPRRLSVEAGCERFIA